MKIAMGLSIIGLAFLWCALARRDATAGEIANDAVPLWLSNADVVFIADASGAECQSVRVCITEIWKASKVVSVSKLPLQSLHKSSQQVLVLITIPKMGAHSKTVMKISGFPISDNRVTADLPNGERHRYSLAELRQALAFEELRRE